MPFSRTFQVHPSHSLPLLVCIYDDDPIRYNTLGQSSFYEYVVYTHILLEIASFFIPSVTLSSPFLVTVSVHTICHRLHVWLRLSPFVLLIWRCPVNFAFSFTPTANTISVTFITFSFTRGSDCLLAIAITFFALTRSLTFPAFIRHYSYLPFFLFLTLRTIRTAIKFFPFFS